MKRVLNISAGKRLFTYQESILLTHFYFQNSLGYDYAGYKISFSEILIKGFEWIFLRLKQLNKYINSTREYAKYLCKYNFTLSYCLTTLII